jgi:hypothetical protein
MLRPWEGSQLDAIFTGACMSKTDVFHDDWLGSLCFLARRGVRLLSREAVEQRLVLDMQGTLAGGAALMPPLRRRRAGLRGGGERRGRRPASILIPQSSPPPPKP